MQFHVTVWWPRLGSELSAIGAYGKVVGASRGRASWSTFMIRSISSKERHCRAHYTWTYGALESRPKLFIPSLRPRCETSLSDGAGLASQLTYTDKQSF